jgi:sporulation protein YlmC with PRC-barrel domain
MNAVRQILLFAISLLPLLCFSQEKVEREVGVKSSKVPNHAKEWLLDAFEEVKKPKWYLEYSQNGRAYEAKFLFKSYFYSVKFDSLGALMDVEIEIDRKEISQNTWIQIQSYFESSYEDIKIQKIQRQLIGDESDVEDYFDEDKKEGVTIRYEIVFDGKNESWAKWEALFDDQGKLISIIRVQERPVDNLIF